MRVLIQRVSEASVSVTGEVVGRIGAGMLILVGVGQQDGAAEAEWLGKKCAGLRIFKDSRGKTNLSLIDVDGAALVVSQFTLYADTRKGRRPSFIHAALPETAEPLVRHFAEYLASHGVPVEHGRFGADMQVALVNDGPVTIWIEREPGV
ncbi:MAG: D-tyrosyl-tRNA(Tyr) deacylase [Anaerolineaceae bacterium]|jgi:D-tyrosyl-tRNA(Tyr) deacylase|nr:D-tyrosyl-tRNA(Tyr) deacylase [Anaerolineaceae bacterium]